MLFSTTLRATPGEVRRDHRGAGPHRDRVAGVAKGDGDRIAVEIVDADHADRGVDRVVGDLAEHVPPVAGLSPVDADRALAPAAADPRRL